TGGLIGPDEPPCLQAAGRAGRSQRPPHPNQGGASCLKPNSEQLRFAPRTLLASGATLQDSPQPFRVERRETMVDARPDSPRWLPCPDGRACLCCLAAAVPAVGFVQRSADLSPLNATALASYAEPDFVSTKHGRRIDTFAC